MANKEQRRLAKEIVMGILDDLGDRKGIGDELDALDEDIRIEMQQELFSFVEQLLIDNE